MRLILLLILAILATNTLALVLIKPIGIYSSDFNDSLREKEIQDKPIIPSNMSFDGFIEIPVIGKIPLLALAAFALVWIFTKKRRYF